MIHSVFWAVRAGASASVLEKDLTSTNSNYLNGRHFLDSHQWNDAASEMQTVLQKDPKSILGLIGLSTALVHLGKREEALTHINQALPRLRSAQRNQLIKRARVLSSLFLSNKTFQIYQDGINFLILKKYKNAREKFEKALLEEGDNSVILTRMGQSAFMDSDLDKALVYLRSAKRMNLYEPQIRLWLGRVLYQKKDFEAALVELRSAQAELPGSELAPVWLAEALSHADQSASAIKLLLADLKAWPLHCFSLMTNIRIRLQGDPKDFQNLITAKKELKLAQSRIQYYSNVEVQNAQKQGDFTFDFRPTPEELIQELQSLSQSFEQKLKNSNLKP